MSDKQNDKKRRELITAWIEQYLVFHHEVVRIKRNHSPKTVHNKAQMGLLFILHYQDNLTIGELAELTHTTSGAVSQLIDNLVKQGFVRRENDQKDRRIVRICLTDSGQYQYQVQRDAKIAAMSWLFDDLTDLELVNMVAIQGKLLTKIKQYRKEK